MVPLHHKTFGVSRGAAEDCFVNKHQALVLRGGVLNDELGRLEPASEFLKSV
jgi:hypothetical protein